MRSSYGRRCRRTLGAVLLLAGLGVGLPQLAAQDVVDPRAAEDPADIFRDARPIFNEPEAIENEADIFSDAKRMFDEEDPAEVIFDADAPIENQYQEPDPNNVAYGDVDDQAGEPVDPADDVPPWGGDPRVLGDRGVVENQYVDLELIPNQYDRIELLPPGYVNLDLLPPGYGRLELRPPDPEPIQEQPNQYVAPEPPAAPEERVSQRQAAMIRIIITISPEAFGDPGSESDADSDDEEGGFIGWLMRVLRGPRRGGRNNQAPLDRSNSIAFQINLEQIEPDAPDWNADQQVAENQYVDWELIHAPEGDEDEPPPQAQ